MVGGGHPSDGGWSHCLTTIDTLYRTVCIRAKNHGAGNLAGNIV